MVSTRDLDDLEEIAKLRAHGRAQDWPIPQIVEAIVDRFGVSRLKAHRLARGWTRPQAVEAILATYDADGWPRPKLTPQRLCAWEHNPRVRPGEEYLDRLCRVYETRADQLGYGHDYTPPAESVTTEPNGQQAVPAAGSAGDDPDPAYAGTPAAPLAAATSENGGADRHVQSDSEETTTNRIQFLQKLRASGMAVLLDRARQGSVRLSRTLGSSNLSPITLEQLELQVADFVQAYDQTPSEELFHKVLDQREEVEDLLNGVQPLRQRRELYRIAGQLSRLLGGLSFDLGDYASARAHCLTALQLAQEVDDHALIAVVRVAQSTVALWAGDFRTALNYAQDGQRYATGDLRARLATQCEGRALARMTDRSQLIDALQRADQAMPSQPGSDNPDGWWVFTPGSLHLYTASSLLWLGDPKQAEPHARQAITYYDAVSPPIQEPALQAQAKINLAICLVHLDQPDEGIRLAGEALQFDLGRVEANFQQAGEFLAALAPRHRDLAAARDFADHLQSLRASRPTLNPG